jgi:uncharacterized protein (TIGR03437 family)
MIQRLVALAWLVSGGTQAASLPKFFEPAGANYVASSHGQLIEVSPRAMRIDAAGAATPMTLEWRGSGGGVPAGEDPTGGVSHYIAGSDQDQWRSSVPHYARVHLRNLYRNTDISYYFRDGHLEFDIVLRPGSDPGAPRFGLPGATHLAVEAGGDLTLEAGGEDFRLRSPRAYQMQNGARIPVECRYAIDESRGVGFQLGPYDRTRELIVDPVVEFLTYLGGSGIDRIAAVATDAAGNIVVAGVTSSANFPGGSTPAGSVSIFVTKLNSTASSVLFTTILGSRSATAANFPEAVSSLAVDSDGSVYVTGQTIAGNFPTTSGAWQQNSIGSFLTRLDSAGKVIYSTFLGPRTWGLTALRVRARNGIAYLAGNFSAPEFLGTSGALQRGNAGAQDFYVLAMAANGSGPVFLTAFGGSGRESLNDMVLDASGNIVLAGTSSSPDLPLTPDALPYPAPVDINSATAVLVRMDSTGSHLISSTRLGTSAASAITALPDGGIALAGAATLPADLIGGAPHSSIDVTGRGAHAYIAKFPAGSNRPVWTTDLIGGEGFYSGIFADAQGNLYWPGYPYTVSGGGLGFYLGSGISKLSADGSRLLFASAFPGQVNTVATVTGTGGTLCIAGYTGSATLPVTPGVVQSQRDPASPGTLQNPLNYDDGFVGVLDLSSFSAGNFFIVPSGSPGVTWRIGEPAPKPVVQSILWSGEPGPLTVTASSRLTASYAASPSPTININANTSATVAGTFQESVTVQSPTNPNASLTIPVVLNVQPQVGFTLATSQVNIRFRQGQQQTDTTVGISTDFGGGYFEFKVVASASWLYGYVSRSDAQHAVLSIHTMDQQPGTYDAVLTISLQGLNVSRTVQVHYVVDPPATIQLSTTNISLHVVKGQPVTPGVVKVTSSVPGVQWSFWPGVTYTWLQITQAGTTTPGELHVTVDPATVQVGYFVFGPTISGENNERIPISVVVDVSSGAPLDATPSSITYQVMRSAQYSYQWQQVGFTSPAPVAVQWKADQAWISPQSGSLTTPGTATFVFDTTIPEGVYQGKITATAGSNTVVIPLTWKLYDMPHLVFPSAPLSFQWRVGDPLPAAQQIQVTCPTLMPDYFQAGATDYPSFLKIDPSYGQTPATLKLTADPTGMAPGTYKTNLSIRGSYPDTAAYSSIPVTLTVLPDPNAPKATVARVADAASYLGGAVAPGEAMVLFGSGLGPAALAQAQPGAGGFPTTLAGWTVYFDEFAAPVLYVSDKQTAVMAPFGVAGRTATSVTVTTGGTPSVAVSVPVASTNPSVFTADSSGAGIAAAVNVASDGSISAHTAASPAARGGVVTIYATGFGVTTPAMTDGSLAAAPLPRLNAAVRVLVGGAAADVLYAGPAPGQIAGLTQINLRIPAAAPSGAASLLVIAGESASQPGVTLAVQ